jgi:capsid protein
VPSIAAVQPLHVATWIEMLTQDEHAASTVKQRLVAVRHLFDWLVVGQVVPVNLASVVRGSSHLVNPARRRYSIRPMHARSSTALTIATLLIEAGADPLARPYNSKVNRRVPRPT